MNLTVIYQSDETEGLAVYVAAGLTRDGHQTTIKCDPTLPTDLGALGVVGGDSTTTEAEARAVSNRVIGLVNAYQLATSPPEEFQP